MSTSRQESVDKGQQRKQNGERRLRANISVQQLTRCLRGRLTEGGTSSSRKTCILMEARGIGREENDRCRKGEGSYAVERGIREYHGVLVFKGGMRLLRE